MRFERKKRETREKEKLRFLSAKFALYSAMD